MGEKRHVLFIINPNSGKKDGAKVLEMIPKHLDSDKNVPHIANMVSKKYVLVGTKALLGEVLVRMVKSGYDSILVEEDSKIKGIITERDVMETLYNYPAMIHKLPVSDVMKHNVISVTPGTSVLDAAALMLKKRIRRLVVVDEDGIKGIVMQSDIMDEMEVLARKLLRS